MIVTINNTDITSMIAYQGLSYQRKDVEGSNAGTALDGYTYRDLVAIKDCFTINLRLLTASELATVLTLLNSEYFTCTVNPHPRTGASKTFQAYTRDIPAAYALNKNGTEYWGGINFTIQER